VNQNCSYIQNPNFPAAYAAETKISFKIEKCRDGVCTLRLDFCTFTLAGPTMTDDTVAAVDTFQITTSPTQWIMPAIGGENAGQHVYVEVGPDAGASATLEFTFGNAAANTNNGR
jgi:archaellin